MSLPVVPLIAELGGYCFKGPCAFRAVSSDVAQLVRQSTVPVISLGVPVGIVGGNRLTDSGEGD